MVLLSLAACGDKAPAPAATAPAPAPAAPAAAPAATPAAAPASTSFSKEELDQMVAPIALYPDPLLAQVLMAATYPGNVADAAAWSKANPNAKGDDAVKQVASQPWDPSVQALVAFPQALDTLGQDPAWVQRLGDAFLAQPDAVMDAVQRLRRQAQAAGNLSSNQYQNVTVQAAPASAPAPAAAPSDGGGGTTVIQEAPLPAEQTIIIEPSDPEVVYVPSYNPTQVYGNWAYPSYPPTYYPPSTGYYAGSALMAGLAFGTGIAVTNALWGDFNWGSNDVDIDVNRYNNINTNRTINNGNWQHNSLNRDGVPYRDNASRERYGRQLDGAQNRDQFRGDDPGRADARNRARDSMQQRGIDAPASSNREARDRAQAADRDLRNNPQARDRVQGGGAQTRDAQRDRAQNAAQQHAARDRSKPTDLGGNRPNAAQDLASRDRSHNADRERARAAAGGSAGDRSQADRQRAQQTAQNRQQQGPQQQRQQQQHRQTQGNNQARQQARTQHASRQSPSNNAFAGARNPQQSRSQANRGGASHASAQRSHQSRGGGGGGGGHQVSRQSHPPQRQGGGGRGR
ncbi:MAG TPA: DUF3300 domain-containing protein [Lysobacter sp.]